MCEPKEGCRTPWGKCDNVSKIADGIHFCGTPGHGGIKLDRTHQAKMGILILAGGWYEEDCEWARVACVFPNDFPEKDRESAKTTLRDWNPGLYEAFYGVQLKEGESHARDEELFLERNKDKYITTSAVGDWHEGVPKGMVGVTACIGGRDKQGAFRGQEKKFLVPADEYQARGFGFVIDTERHKEWVTSK